MFENNLTASASYESINITLHFLLTDNDLKKVPIFLPTLFLLPIIILEGFNVSSIELSSLRNSGENSTATAVKLFIKDFFYALIGLIISIAIAIGVNDQLTFSSMLVEIPKEFIAGLTKFFGKLGF